jgi:F-type H+-transporting ATPase subunit b
MDIFPKLQEVLTQAFGFLIVFLVLKKFAWGPLLGLLDERKETIAGEFRKVEKKQAELEAKTADYDHRISAIEDEARERIRDAVKEGERLAGEIQARAREDAKEILEKAKRTVELEIAQAKVELKEEIVALTITATEKIIKERMDDAKHRQLIDEFLASVEKE